LILLLFIYLIIIIYCLFWSNHMYHSFCYYKYRIYCVCCVICNDVPFRDIWNFAITVVYNSKQTVWSWWTTWYALCSPPCNFNIVFVCWDIV